MQSNETITVVKDDKVLAFAKKLLKQKEEVKERVSQERKEGRLEPAKFIK